MTAIIQPGLSVLWLDGNSLAAVADRYCHHFAKLSKGEMVNGTIRCSYHGWAYDSNGSCVDLPQLTVMLEANWLKKYGTAISSSEPDAEFNVRAN